MTILRSNFGRCNWLGKVSFFLILVWLLTVLLSVNYILNHNSTEFEEDNQDIAERLRQLSDTFQILKKQNYFLRNIIMRSDLKTIQEKEDYKNLIEKNHENPFFFDVIEKQNGLVYKYDEPSLIYEETKRKIKNDLQEMWFFMTGELNKIKKSIHQPQFNSNNEISIILKQFSEYKNMLSIYVDKLTQIDGYQKWRETEALELSQIIQNRFRYLQNPKNCNTARKIVCNINKGCGFGCQMHHLVYCFAVAYGTERTLILKSKGWRYQKEGWESVFKPLSDTCISADGETHANWPGDHNKQVITLPIVDNVYPKPVFQPPSVPADLGSRLKKIHGYPLVWWVGQILKYLMRPNNNTKELLENKKKEFNFVNPVVGIHIRRTDKVGTEAAFHDVDEYMLKVQQYYDTLEIKPKVKRVFLASDDPKVIVTAKQRYPDYTIIADPNIAQTASISRRYSNLSLQGIIIDIHFLSLSDYLVCTFSSQVCRVAYELMQTYHLDAHNKFSSLDDIYYYGGQNPHPQMTIMNHVSTREGEIELKVNDEVEVYGNHWNGFSKGRNLRTGKIGLFPSFKIKNTVKIVEFPKYENVFSNKT